MDQQIWQNSQADSTESNELSELFSKKKKLEFLAHHFNPDDFPPSDDIMSSLAKEFNLNTEDPFMFTNQVLMLLDQVLEQVKLVKND